MLINLSIRNVVIIDKLDLTFNGGLTVLTGETGAGKSILLDSLSLVLGARADASLVRHGEKEASVTASFSLPLSHGIGEILSRRGYPFDGEIILRRIVSNEGRSRAFLNDEPISVSFLKEVGELLAEIHGQFASYRLLNPATHLGTLDRYGALNEHLKDCRHLYSQWQYKKRQRDEAEQTFMQAEKEEEFLRTSVSDLEKLNPQPDEEENLIARRTRLMNSEKITTALNTAYAILSDENVGCVRTLGSALSQLERANQLSEAELSDVSEQISQSIVLVEDSVSTIEKEIEKWGDVSELPAIDDRLFALRDMARKHRVEISQLPNLLLVLKKKLTQLELGEDAIIKLRQEEEKARQAYILCAKELSEEREKIAERLDKAVAKELPALKLGKATFKTEKSALDEVDWTEMGMDKIAFMVSTNKGTPLAPIHKVASGGELARFMLALKVNLAMAEEADTLVFDEVDTGVGGATAAAVGARLKQLAQTNQVLVVTHSPQVAAHGQNHLTVQKKENGEQVCITVEVLDAQKRQDEIARMLSGEKITKTATNMAKELLESCQKECPK